MRPRRLAARWLIPVEGGPIERAALLIGSDGRIEAVGPDASVPRPADAGTEDFGEAVILPGLINTHSHLELTGFASHVPAREFPVWIKQLRELKTTRTPAEYVAAARRGLEACYASGVTTVADTGDSGAAIRALAEANGSGIAYQEVFGPHPSQAQASLAALRDRVIESGRWAVHRVRLGVSPHAPYTVSGPLLKAVARWASSQGLPLAVHVAESRAETELLMSGDGEFASAWQERGIPMPQPLGRTPVEWLDDHGALTERTLCIHAVQIAASDVELLARRGAAVAHCPLSNAAHGHGEAPLSALLARGVRVGLGTDSEVSVGPPNLWAEARAAARLASLSPEDTIELCTLGGARALGLAGETGSLVKGKWADCAVLHVGNEISEHRVAEHVLGSSRRDLIRTCVGGRDVYRAP